MEFIFGMRLLQRKGKYKNMKEKLCDCCILMGRKFYKNDKVDRVKLSIHFEKWYREQIAFDIKEQFAYSVIAAYAKNLCDCLCHKENKNV